MILLLVLFLKKTLNDHLFQEERLDTCLEGHNGQVTCAEFSTCQTSILVTAGDDRTFKVTFVSQ